MELIGKATGDERLQVSSSIRRDSRRAPIACTRTQSPVPLVDHCHGVFSHCYLFLKPYFFLS